MNKTDEYFIRLIKSFLTGERCEYSCEADYDKIFYLAEINGVSGIIAKQISLFSEKEKAKIKNFDEFKQQLGFTVISYESKCSILSQLNDDFNKNSIDYMLVKGAVLRDYYPAPALRTSGDTDLIFRSDDYQNVKSIYDRQNINYEVVNEKELVFRKDGEMVELHSDKDFDNDYFIDIFSKAEKSQGCKYLLSDEEHLMYVLCHTAKHLNSFGAGVKMFMDIDVLVRKINGLNFKEFLEKCRKAHIETFAKAALTLCSVWFDTPVEKTFDYSNEEFFDAFQKTIIEGGTFGFESRNLGDYYVRKGLKSGGKSNFLSKFNALLHLIFPGGDYLKLSYPYCDKYPFLLPAAWFNRLIDGIFKRGKHSKNTVSEIMKANGSSVEYYKLLQELEL